MRSIIVIAVIAFAVSALANEGTGTMGFCERHGCGAPEDPGTVTECPTLVCPDVVCEATDCAKTTVVVNPTPVTCPTVATNVTFPSYYPCKRTKKGVRCPRPGVPHRVIMPESDAKKYGAK